MSLESLSLSELYYLFRKIENEKSWREKNGNEPECLSLHMDGVSRMSSENLLIFLKEVAAEMFKRKYLPSEKLITVPTLGKIFVKM